jgi:hypothetical protein
MYLREREKISVRSVRDRAISRPSIITLAPTASLKGLSKYVVSCFGLLSFVILYRISV